LASRPPGKPEHYDLSSSREEGRSSMTIANPERVETQPETAPAASPVDRNAAPVSGSGRKSGKATTAMVCGIIGVLACIIPIVAWVLGGVALGLGLAAKKEIRRFGMTGNGKATTGIVLGVIAIFAGLLVFFANVAAMN
jgi:hypothetical protein